MNHLLPQVLAHSLSTQRTDIYFCYTHIHSFTHSFIHSRAYYVPGTVLSIGIQHWKKKKRQSLAPTELIHKEAKTVNKAISDCGKCRKNYDGGDMMNLDLGRHLL